MFTFAIVSYCSDDIPGGSRYVIGVGNKFIIMLFCCLYDF